MPSARIIVTVVGLTGVGEKKIKGTPIIAVNTCPNSIPLDLDWSSARPVVMNIDAKIFRQHGQQVSGHVPAGQII